MQPAGSTSWRFAEADSQQVLLALWVRDALRLEVGAGPPPLAGTCPDRRDVLPGLRDAATRQWPAWWRAAVAEAVLLQDGRPRPPGPPLDGSRVGDPAPSADGDELRQVIGTLMAEGLRGTAALPRVLQAFRWQTVREVTEDVAFDHGVDVGRLRATALVLPVGGRWWQPVAPGVVLCSPAAAQDPVAGRVVLRADFTTALTPA